MQVKNALPCVGAVVDDEAVAGCEAELLGDVASGAQDPTERLDVRRLRLVHARKVAFGNHEHVRWSNRTDVSECKDVLVLEEDVRGRRLRDDIAEEASSRHAGASVAVGAATVQAWRDEAGSSDRRYAGRMCGRTALTASPEDLRDVFGLDETPHLATHYNVPPSQPLSVVRVLRGSSGRRLESLRWGLVPRWAEDAKIGHKLALARVETVATTAAFREAIRRRRCLIAVDGFYEWRRHGKTSDPFFVRRVDRKPFALAGVWDRWVSKDGELVESCAILTQPARAPVDAVHDRMPLVLEAELWDRWLDRALTDADAIAPLLAPRSPDLVAYQVGPWVNDPRHDDPACLERVEPTQGSLF
jgi:putative SOS response-associated peptidase YedK